jgi:hypothetical protein
MQRLYDFKDNVLLKQMTPGFSLESNFYNIL